jgi:hypothetical protein
MSVELKFEGENLGIFKRFSFIRAASAWAEEIGPEIEDAIKEAAPVRSGQLKNSIESRKSRGFSGVALEFYSTSPHAAYVEGGTPPHIIRPRSARYLRFIGRGGDVVYSQLVHHPGMRANPFAARAVEEMLPEIVQRFEEDVQSQFRK